MSSRGLQPLGLRCRVAIAAWPWLTCSTPWWAALTALTQASGALQQSSYLVRPIERRLPCLMSRHIAWSTVPTQRDAEGAHVCRWTVALQVMHCHDQHSY